MRSAFRHVPLLIIVLGSTVLPLSAQGSDDVWNARSLELSRGELEALRDRFEQVMASGAYSEAIKQQARSELGRVNERLGQGDFRSGDRIVLRVQGETKIPDTLVVGAGPAVTIPFMGDIDLKGVLRSELQQHMNAEIGRFIRDPVVDARALIRVSVEGSVMRPGYYLLLASLPLTDVIMAAGGPAPDADLSGLEVRRGGAVIVGGRTLQEATAEGRSLDQLSILAGDALVVPSKAIGSVWKRVGSYMLVLGSTVLTAILIGR